MRVRAKEECFIGGARRMVGEEFETQGDKCPKCCEPASAAQDKKAPGKKEPRTFSEIGDKIQ